MPFFGSLGTPYATEKKMPAATAEMEDISSVLNAEFRKFLITWRKLVHLAVQGHQPDETTISQAAALLNGLP